MFAVCTWAEQQQQQKENICPLNDSNIVCSATGGQPVKYQQSYNFQCLLFAVNRLAREMAFDFTFILIRKRLHLYGICT